jgi:small subunit ribosomal protein S1
MGVEDIDLGEDFDFGAMLDQSLESKENNSVVDGVVVAINGSDVLVDVSEKSEGKLNIDEITIDGEVKFKEGDTIPVMITGTRGERPSISYKKVLQKKLFDEFVENTTDIENSVVEGKVVSVKPRSGFMVQNNDGLEFFMPLAQGYLKVQDSIGKKVKAKVLKVNNEQNSIVISRKKLIDETKAVKEARINEILEADEVVSGKIKKITSYGMFVDLGGVDGLVNYNEISYKGPVNPAEYYEEGDEIEVKLINYDKEKGHISLSIKAALPNPWEEIKDELDVGDVITVTISNFETYGAFVDLGNDIEGLLHISEISHNKNINNPKDILNIGDEVNVEVIELDADKKRLRVSLKSLQEKPFDKFSKEHKVGDVISGKVVTIAAFGAFVSLGGVDGLLHNEESSWDRNVKCKDMFKKGDELDVKIIKIDREKENISLSIKDIIDSPAAEFQKENKVGSIITGTVKDKKDFGVFITLKNNLDGLIRTEDLTPLNEEDIKIGDEIESVVVNVDTKKNKVRLSVKRLERQKERDALNSINDNSEMTLGDLIKDKIK